MNTSKKKKNRVGVYSVYAASFPIFFSHHNEGHEKLQSSLFSTLRISFNNFIQFLACSLKLQNLWPESRDGF
jgi:hypothetical protein